MDGLQLALQTWSPERLGDPTQKPEALLERIIQASCPDDGTVLDPFCGCGTTIVAAQKLGRPWIGIDVTHLAVGLLIKHRLADAFGLVAGEDYEVVGEPTDLGGARELAADDPWQFQAWALGLVGARTATSARRGSDKGIDGQILFHDEGGLGRKRSRSSLGEGGPYRSAARPRPGRRPSTGKGGDRRVVSMQKPTQPMRTEAASHGFYRSPGFNRDYQKVQLISIEEALDGKQIDYPHQAAATFNVAPKPGEEDLGPPQEEQLFDLE